MSGFVAKYIFIPRYQRACDECRAPMPLLAAIAPLARLTGWSFHGYVWLCRAHSASRNPAIRKRIDDELAEIRSKSAVNLAQSRAEMDRELISRMGYSPPSELPRPLVSDPAPAESKAGAFAQVLVVAEEAAFPFAESLEQKLLNQIAQHPRFPLTSNATVTTLRVPELPAEARESLEPFVWALQSRFDRRGGRWQGEFYPTPVGVTFLVVYLE